ncbi:putative ribonuclease H-like domain-containing protein [Tanacetum coccineum]
MPTTHDDEDCCKLMKSIDLKPKNGITFDKSKIECFNCQKLGHFARECRFAKYQENKANGRNEKRIVAIEDSNPKALVATDNNEDIDWTKEFDAEPVTYAMMALTGVEQDDWSIEFDAEHMHFGQDGLGDFDWSNKADDAPISLALMATNSEVPYCSKCRFGIESSNSMESDISSGDETLTDSTYENFKREKAYKAVPPPTDSVDSDDEETDVQRVKKETVLTKSIVKNPFKTGVQGNKDQLENIQRVNHSNFTRNSRYPQQRRSFIPSAVLTRDGLISTARPKMTQTVPSKSTANVTYQDTARSRVPQAVLSRSTDGSYYPRMDNRRPRISSYSPSSRSSTTRTPHRPQRPKKVVKLIWVKKGSTVGSQAVLPQTVKKSAMISPKQTWKQGNYLDSVNRGNGSYTLKQFEYGNPEEDLKDYAIIDSGCSGSMTGDKDKLSDFKEFKGGYVAFGNDSKVYLLSVLQISDKKHNVLFTDKECLILSPKFKFVDEDLWMKLFKAQKTGHVNFKNINKLVKGNLVRGLPSKTFKLDHSCVACRKGKQHRASCKKIEERTVREPLELLHMDLFGPVSVESINKKKYCLVVTDDCSKFSWVFFLAYKDETYDMLHDLIVGLENRLRHKVKTIRCDHGTEFKNQLMNEFCAKKGIKREYSIARTPQQNGVAERKNRTLIEAARTMLADSLLPIQFWAEAVNTACYRPFGCSLLILNLWIHLGKFDASQKKDSVGKENYADLKNKDYLVDELKDMGTNNSLFITHSLYATGGTYCAKEVTLSSEDSSFNDELSSMVKDFEDLMQKEFKMSSMGELTFFLGLQVKQSNGGIFLSQDKYVKDILNKFDFRTIKPASTPIEAHKSVGKMKKGEDVDVSFQDFKVTQSFSDSDYAGDNHDRRSTSGGCQYLGRRLVVVLRSSHSIGSGGSHRVLVSFKGCKFSKGCSRLSNSSAAHSQVLVILKVLLTSHRLDFMRIKKLKQQKATKKEAKEEVFSLNCGRNKDEGILSEELKFKKKNLAHPFFDDTADRCCILIWIDERPRRFEHPGPILISPQQPLKIEDGHMIHMLVERRYLYQEELMIRMLDNLCNEVEDESETALTFDTSVHFCGTLKKDQLSRNSKSASRIQVRGIVGNASQKVKVNIYQFCQEKKPNVYSHVQVTGYVLGLPNVTTWDEIEKKMGARKSKTYADKAKGKERLKNHKVNMPLKVAGKWKPAALRPSNRDTRKKTQKVMPQGSKAIKEPSYLLDVDSDPDIYELLVTLSVKGRGRKKRSMLNLRQSEQVERLHVEYRRLVLEEKKWVNYEQTLASLRSKVEGLEAERERLEKSEVQLLQEIDGLKQDRVAVVTNVVSYIGIELAHSDEIGLYVARLVTMAIIHGRCTTFEEVSALKEPFEL